MLLRTLTALLLVFPLLVPAQDSHHGLSLRAGAKAMNFFNITQPDPAVAAIVIEGNHGYGGSLRYNYFTGERLSFYAGIGLTNARAWLLFEQPATNGLPFRSRGGPQVSQRVTHIEWGASYAYPLSYRFSLVTEVGGQRVSVARGGGRGSRQVSDADGNTTFRTEYSYLENPDEQTGYALQVSPGVRLRLSDNFYLTLRGDFIFSSVLLLEQGLLEAGNSEFPETREGTFERHYAGQGLDLLLTCRF